MNFLGLHTSPYLNHAVGATGVLSLGIGLLVFVKPLLMLEAFDIPASSNEARKVARDLLVVFAARDLALGFGITSAAYYGHKEIMGWSMLGVAVIASLDGWVTKGNGKGGEWKHWSCIGLGLGLAGACFGYV